MNVKKTSVSFPESLLEKANKRWREAGHTSLSAYLQHLIRQDAEEHPGTTQEPATTYNEVPALLDAIRGQTEAINKLIQQSTQVPPLKLAPPPSDASAATTGSRTSSRKKKAI